MNWELSSREEPEFELAIIEKYLELNPEDMIAVERRLVEAYKTYGLGRSEEADKRLNMVLNEALRCRNDRTLEEVGRIFYRLDRAVEFKNKLLGKHPNADYILRRLDLEPSYH